MCTDSIDLHSTCRNQTLFQKCEQAFETTYPLSLWILVVYTTTLLRLEENSKHKLYLGLFLFSKSLGNITEIGFYFSACNDVIFVLLCILLCALIRFNSWPCCSVYVYIYICLQFFSLAVSLSLMVSNK